MIAALVKREFFKNHVVSLQTVRYKRVNLRKPRPPHFQAQKVQKVLDVKIPRPYDVEFPSFLKCRKPLKNFLVEKIEENPYERILANELIELFEDSKMILFFHRNPLSGEDFYGSVKTFKKVDMKLIRVSKTTVKMAVENTKYLPIMNLFHSHTLIICSPVVRIDTVFKLSKKMPQYILLGGIIENRFVHKNKLEEFSKLPDLDAARGLLVDILNNVTRQLTKNFIFQQSNLILNFNNYVKQ